tara:strand:+ start:25550 stop:26275 length:726 start_codon:yes stop_codon:yes gene_type:complete
VDHITVLEQSDHEGVLILTTDRPKQHNALNIAMWEALRDALAEARNNRARCVVLTGAEGAFSSGGDWVEASIEGDEFIERVYGLTHEVVEALYVLPCPTIAMIPGPAIQAGLELALACDFRFAGVSSVFDIGFTRFAAPPEAISEAMLPRLLGLEQAKRWVFSGERRTGEQARTFGLVSEFFSDDSLRDETLSYASELAKGPTPAYASSKTLMNESFEKPVQETLAAANRLETRARRQPML